MSAAEHQQRVNALVAERQAMQEALEENRILLQAAIAATSAAIREEATR